MKKVSELAYTGLWDMHTEAGPTHGPPRRTRSLCPPARAVRAREGSTGSGLPAAEAPARAGSGLGRSSLPRLQRAYRPRNGPGLPSRPRP